MRAGRVPWKVNPVAQATRREPQFPAMARQWIRPSGRPHGPISNAWVATSRTARDIAPRPRAAGWRPNPIDAWSHASPGRRSTVPPKRGLPSAAVTSMAQRFPPGSFHSLAMCSRNATASARVY